MSWRASAPKTRKERRELLARCGSKAFLDPKGLRFPVIGKSSKTCRIDCRGLKAARNRSAQHHYRKIEKKALVLAVKKHCSWV